MGAFQLDYQNKYVAFLDVLGFKELVYRDDKKVLETYFNTILEVLDEIEDDKKEIKSLSISDSIILFAPDDVRQFKLLLTAIRTIQCELLKKDILIRGAVSFGEAQFDKDNNIIVGKGYINAYLLEAKALYPRVIIDPIIIPKLGSDRTSFMKTINGEAPFQSGRKLLHDGWFRIEGQDSYKDNLIFVDYLNRLFDDYALFDMAEQLKKLLIKHLYGKPEDIPKYNWLQYYLLESFYILNFSSKEADKTNKSGELMLDFSRL